MGSCWVSNNGGNKNVWFKFNADNNYIKIQVKTGGVYGNMQRQQVALWDASGTEIACARYVTNQGIIILQTDQLIPLDDYYISVDDDLVSGTFTLCLTNIMDYDFKDGALYISNTTGWCSADALYSNIFATDDFGMGSCWTSNNGGNKNVWFRFTAATNFARIRVRTGTVYGTMQRQQLAVYDGTDTEIGCLKLGTNQGTLSLDINTLTPGDDYWVSVDDDLTNGTFTLCINCSPLSVNVSGTDITCFGLNDGSATASATGGTAPYTYLWTGPGSFVSTSSIITNLIPGTYNVTVTDSKSDFINGSAIISQPALALNGSISSQTNVSCSGGSDGSVTVAGAGGTGPYQYKLDAGSYQVSGVFGSLSAGSYVVTVKDDHNCTVTVPVTITTIADVVVPVLTCPAPISVQCSADVPSPYGNFVSFTGAGGSAVDNCAVSAATFAFVSDVTDGLNCPETITRTYHIADNSGNFGTCTQAIIIKDTQAPTWTTAAGALNTSVSCSDATAITAAQALFPVAADNCDADVTNIVKVAGAFVPGACEGSGTYTNTWTVTDDCANVSAVYTQVITLSDTQAPTWTTAAGALNTSVSCSDATAITAAQALFPVAADNCDADVTNIVKVAGAFVPGACEGSGTYTNTWTVTDDCANVSAVYTQVITLSDTQAPTWTTAAGALNTSVSCSDATAITAAQALFPVAADNCDADVTNIVKVAGAFVPGACEGSGTYTNTWTVTDDCANVSAVYTQVITLSDTQAPTWTTAAGALNTSVSCSDATAITAAQALFPVAADNCDADVTNIVKVAGAFVPGACEGSGTYTNTWTVTDDCANVSAVYTQVITLSDTQAPTWTTAAGALNTSVSCSDATAITAAQALFPVAADNCDADVTNIVKVAGAFVPGACEGSGTYTNTWTVTDDCANVSAVYTQVITLSDTQAPTWTTAAGALNTSVSCSDATAITAAQALFPVAADNCDADVTNIVKVAGAFVPGACEGSGTYTNTWTVTDDCANVSAVYTQVITLSDTQAPTWTTAAGALNTSVSCSDATAITAAQALFPVAADNCDADVTNIVKVAGAFVPGACEGSGTYTNTWTVTDDCANVSAVYTQVITLSDTQAPTWTTAAGALNTSVSCSDATAITAAQALFPVAADNCDADVTNIVKVAGAFVPGACEGSGTYTNTWTVTDDCANVSAVYTQVITLSDTQAPTWTTAAGALNTSVSCSDATAITAAQALFPVAADNCDADVTNIVKVAGAFVPGACEGSGTYTNTWTVTDDCANVSAVYTQVITLSDTQAPTWTTAAGALNTSVSCSDATAITAAQALFPVAADNCDADVTNIVKVAGAFVPGACEGSGTYTNTWTVTDDCANVSAVYTQVITLSDTQAPTWTTAAGALNTSVSCSDATAITAAQALFPVAADNCDADVTNIVKVAGAFVPGLVKDRGHILIHGLLLMIVLMLALYILR